MAAWSFVLGVLACAQVAFSQLTNVQKDNILSVHNALRGEVFPTAADMQELRWDAQLADIAQEHTDRCQWTPNSRANISARNIYPEGVGENMAFSIQRSTVEGKVQPARFVHEWFVESSFYNYSTNQCAERETCSHYKQIVASGVTAIGCAFNTCPSFNFFSVNLPNASFFVCVYGPIGMPFEERPYTEGTPCTACPLHLTGCASKLCTVATGTDQTPTARNISRAEAFHNTVGGTIVTTDTPVTNRTTTNTADTATTAEVEVKTHAPGTVIPSTNITAPPLLTMPPNGYDVITNPYTTPEPTMIPTLLPNHCNAPATPELRESCWREAWMLWTNKYNQWAAGQCEGQRTTPQTSLARGGSFVA